MGKTIKKILIISYTFPPMMAAGSYRIAAFAKYLPKFGFKPFVATVSLNRWTWNGPIDHQAEETGTVYRLPGAHTGSVISWLFRHRISGYGKSRQEYRSEQANVIKRLLGWVYDEIITFPDPHWPWYILGRKQAVNIAKNLKPDIILSSALPFSAHLIAADIKKSLGVPWVADYRDLLSNSHFTASHGRFKKKYQLRLEKKKLHLSDMVTTVSKPLAKDMAKLTGQPVHVITNGFDTDNRPDLKKKYQSEWNQFRFNIVYTGMIYLGFQNIAPLAEAIKLLVNNRKIKTGDIAVWIYGPNSNVVEPLVRQHLVSAFFQTKKPVSHDIAIQMQKDADLLLFLEWNDTSQKGVFTTKFFEYLGAGKPIIGIGPKGGIVDETLKATGAGMLEDDAKRISESLLCYIQNRFFPGEKRPYESNPEELIVFTREYQIQKLARLLNELI